MKILNIFTRKAITIPEPLIQNLPVKVSATMAASKGVK